MKSLWFIGMAAAAILALPFASIRADEATASFAATSSALAKAGAYDMPEGDFAAAGMTAGSRVEIPLRIPPGYAGATGSEAAAGATKVGPGVVPAAITKECSTNFFTGFAPSDIHGAATPTNLVVVTNVDIGIYRKSDCTVVRRIGLKRLFGAFGIPSTTTLFDPRVLYDRPAQRCLVTAESSDSSNTDQFLYIAASRTNTCTSWNIFRLTLSSGASFFCKNAVTDFYDYPNAGYNRDSLVVTSNNFGSSVVGTLLSIRKAGLYSGVGSTAFCFNNLATNVTPAVVAGTGSSLMYILSPQTSGSILRLRLDTSVPSLVGTASIIIPAWGNPPKAVQPNGQIIDTVDGRFESASKQIGSSIWNVHTIAFGGFAKWRLYKLSTTGTSPLFTFGPVTTNQTGCLNGDDLFSASLDTNSSTLGSGLYLTSSRTCRFGGAAGFPAHLIFRGANNSTAGWVFNLVETSAFQFASCPTPRGCRWGDYSATQIDPSNVANAWGFNQLVRSPGASQFDWITRAGRATP